MFIYLGIFILSSFFSIGVSSTKFKENRIIYKFITFMILFIPMAIRDGIGVDYPGYIEIFNKISLGSNTRIETGWWWLNRIIFNLGGNGKTMIAVVSFLSLYLLLSEIEDYQWKIYVPVCVMILYSWLFTTLRQMLAVCLIFNAILKFEKKKYFRFIIYSVLSFLFHKSALFYIPIFLIVYFFKLNKRTAISIYLMTLFFTVLLLPRMLNVFYNLIGLSSIYGRYLASEYIKQTAVSTGLGFMLQFFVYFLLICCYPEPYKKREKMVLTLFVFFTIFMFLSMQIQAINRISRGIIFVFLPLAGITYNSNKKTNNQIYFLCYLIIFLLDLRSGFHGSIPYKTIF